VTLKVEYRLRVFGSRRLWKIYGAKMKGETKD
jgi:hypothetical protein